MPDAYQEVDYIQSSCSGTTEGTNGQRIATGFSPKNTSKIELKISDFTQNGSFALFGEDQSRGTRGFTIISRSYEFGVNAVFDDGTATTRTICDGGTHTIELSQSGLIVDGATIATPASASFTGVELNLFAMNRNGTAREFGGFKMYYCKLWDGETLVRDFVPCYRKSDNVIGMYDLVNDQFYTNSGSGSFTKGTDSSTLVYKEFQVWPEVEAKTTVVCDFRSGASGEKTTYSQIANSQFLGYTNTSCYSQGTNGTLRLKIPATDQSAVISLGARGNNGYNNGASAQNGVKQNLIKRAYLKISTLYGSSSGYPVFNAAGVFVSFNKKSQSTNRYDRGATTYYSRGGFVFPRGNNSSYPSYITKPIDSNTQYLALPSHANTGYGATSTSYIDQGTSCIYSRLTLETRGTSPSDFHYWLIVGATGNEYDLGLCSSLGSAWMEVTSSDWWMVNSYKEISEAYLEVFDDYYIDQSGNITTIKPR